MPVAELERLVDAEGAYERERGCRRGLGHGHGKHRRKKSFLDDVFDFG
ncbi:MAG TPA: hypothetical protein VGW75_08465 [Solirubrobacteraceae bacterium]|jgi:hypothetical protein|nr:hypothetical protein [Solirubrobacteraceae bacterium]